uniref:Uncharacterized protein n=1 Tax=Oncorhynchus kisutch TaxID=8019 RepID=A0A8C7MSG8_ONCKI
NAFRISTPLSAQQSALTLTKSQSYTHSYHHELSPPWHYDTALLTRFIIIKHLTRFIIIKHLTRFTIIKHLTRFTIIKHLTRFTITKHLTRDTVVKEREDALRLLQTGQERARPGYTGLLHALPWYMNKRCKRFYTPLFVTPHMRNTSYAKNRKQNGERQKQAGLQEKFPQMKARTS